MSQQMIESATLDAWSDELIELRTENKRLRKLAQDLIDNDPDEIISDAGHSVLDLWRHEARKVLGPQTNGGKNG